MYFNMFSVCFLVMLCFLTWAGVQSTPVKMSEKTSSRPSCVYENSTYLAGEKFQPEPCLHCHCPHHGGRARCAIQDCRRDPACVRVDYTHEPCCGTCAQVGCIHSDGKTYPPGAIVLASACETCTCPEGGGRTVCEAVRCLKPNCVNPVKAQGKCCHTCPDGENCWLEDEIIPAGKVIQVGPCKSCTCPPSWAPNWVKGRHLRAICSSSCKQ